MDSLKSAFSSMTGEQQNESCFPQLSFSERMIGFAICCVLGYIIQLLSFGSFITLATGNPTKFAVLYSVGNILSLAATGFLLGFKRQLQQMVDPQRRYTTIIFGSAMAGTLISSLVLHSKLLVILFLIVQIPAYIWYCATYIPFARDCIKSCLRGTRDRILRK